jgi:flagellar biosynthetic protein FlhB
VQTVFVLFSGLVALLFTGREIWQNLGQLMYGTLAHLHETAVKLDGMQRFAIDSFMVAGSCLWPVLVAVAVGGLLAAGMQSRFRTAPDALAANWERLNPINGIQRIFSFRSAVPLGISVVKLAIIIGLSYNVIAGVLKDPIFYSTVDVARIGQFLADSAFKIIMRIGFALVVLAAVDYAYQIWRNNQDMMMTKEEVKDEVKNQEGDAKVKARMRSRRRAAPQRKMFADVPKADVVITNPTHLAVALRYDRKSMGAPRIVAKGSRLNALRIREIATQHQIPIIENKPLARMMFKYGKVGGEIPAQLYVAVAEILAYVYRTNAYRYYREQQLTG